MDDRQFLQLSAGYLGEYHDKIRACVAPLGEEQVWWRPNPASNSVGNLLLHLSGCLSEWLLKGLGGRAFERHRNAEFAAREDASKAALLAQLGDVVAACQQVVRHLPPAELSRSRPIRGEQVDGIRAVYHSVEHMSYHTGQIAFIAKQLVARDLALD